MGKSNSAAEQSSSLDTINDIINTLENIKQTLPSSPSEEKGPTPSIDIAQKIDGLHDFFKIIRSGITGNLISLAFGIPGLIKKIKQHLTDRSLLKTEESGTEYLLSLFNLPPDDAMTLRLAQYLVNILDLIKAYDQGFFLSLVKKADPSAEAKIAGLVTQLPKLEEAIAQYENHSQALTLQAQKHTLPLSSSQLSLTPSSPISPASKTQTPKSDHSNEDSPLPPPSPSQTPSPELEEKIGGTSTLRHFVSEIGNKMGELDLTTFILQEGKSASSDPLTKESLEDLNETIVNLNGEIKLSFANKIEKINLEVEQINLSLSQAKRELDTLAQEISNSPFVASFGALEKNIEKLKKDELRVLANLSLSLSSASGKLQYVKGQMKTLQEMHRHSNKVRLPSLDKLEEGINETQNALNALSLQTPPSLSPLENNLRDRKSAQIERNLARQQFVFKYTNKLKDYLVDRARTFKIRDFFSRVASFFLSCLGYTREKINREKYITRTLSALENFRKNSACKGALNAVLDEGILNYSPRATKGPAFGNSLRFFLASAKRELEAAPVTVQAPKNSL